MNLFLRYTLSIFLIFAQHLITSFVAQAGDGGSDPLPSDWQSTLSDNNGKEIKDSELANMMKDLLVSGNEKNIHDAKFLFQECYGGGMLDDLQRKLGNTVVWIGGSASSWGKQYFVKTMNGVAFGQRTSDEETIATTKEPKESPSPSKQWIVESPNDWWTKTLLPQLSKEDTMFNILTAVRGQDPVGIKGTEPVPPRMAREDAQIAFSKDGDKITLKDTEVQSYHAILWAFSKPGKSARVRSFNDIKNIRDTLVTQWGQPNGDTVTISVLYGDGKTAPNGKIGQNGLLGTQPLPPEWGAIAATKANLIQELQKLKDLVNPNAEFFFYASGHGSTWLTPTKAENGSIQGAANVQATSSDIQYLDLEPSILGQLRSEPDPEPYLLLEYSGLSGPADVYINDKFIGELSPNNEVLPPPSPLVTQPSDTIEQKIIIPKDYLELSNTIRVENNSGSDFVLSNTVFNSGECNCDPNTFVCDADNDEDVDKFDINLIIKSRGTSAGVLDPRDSNGDGIIDKEDARLCTKQCQNSNCAP